MVLCIPARPSQMPGTILWLPCESGTSLSRGITALLFFRDPQIRNYGISSTRATCSLAADSRGIHSQRALLAALEIAIRGTPNRFLPILASSCPQTNRLLLRFFRFALRFLGFF